VAIKVDDSIPFEDYNLSYKFYYQLVRDEIYNVEPPVTQQNLFE